MKRKKMILTVIIGVYIGVIIFASLLVPVKASIPVGNGETYWEYGYYPLWKINNPVKQEQETDLNGEEVTVTINVTAWVIQYIFITLVFISLVYSVFRHYQAASRPPG